MPRIDALLTAMVSNHADAVTLADGEIAHLVVGGNLRPLTRQPLAEGQLVALLCEMAPAHMAQQLAAVRPLEFLYSSEAGSFITRLRSDGGRVSATVTLAEPAAANGKSYEPSARPPNDNAATSPDENENENEHEGDRAPAGPTAGEETMTDSEADERRAAVVRSSWNISGPPLDTSSLYARPAEPADARKMTSAAVEGDPTLSTARSAIEELLKALVDRSASDLHLRVGEAPILRIHGELKRMRDAEPLTNALLESMLVTIMPERNLAEYRELNDTDFAYEIEGVARFRANAFRDHHGAAGVFRVIPAKVATVEELGITPEVQALCYLTKGLVLVTGPTGSGKSTTLGGLIDLVNRSRDDHVITIEDPIEFVHVNKRCVISQRQVGMHTASFKSALRAALREDPDIVLVGEMRDLETVSIALETAETGHLVFGTLHTTTAVGTIDRIIDQFPADRQAQIRVMLADTLKGVISQTLCKKIGGGRVAAREILLSVPAVANLIREGKAFQLQSVMQTSRRHGMILLGDVLIDLVDKGLVEVKEAYMKSTDKPAFLNALKTRGHDVSFMMA